MNRLNGCALSYISMVMGLNLGKPKIKLSFC